MCLLFTCSLIGSMVGVFSILFLEVHRNHFQSQAVAEDEIQTLSFNNTEFNQVIWIEKGKEFEMNGKLYDVLRIESIKNKFIVTCKNDNWEEEFISLFHSWKNHKTSDGKIKLFFQPMGPSEKIGISEKDFFFIDLKYVDAPSPYHSLPVSQPFNPPKV